MFKKVLIADDLDSIHHGVLAVTEALEIPEVVQVHYCDDAYLKVKKGVKDNAPFELLITDLSYKSDHRAQVYGSGEALIGVLREEHPELKVIVYSVEDRSQKVKHFFEACGIHGYVCKSRKGMEELKQAIEEVHAERQYVSPQIQHALSAGSDLEVDDYDIELMRLLSNGLSQEEISNRFKEEGVSPCSLSSIEKRLNKLRIQFKANNAIHLVAVVKDLGLI